MSNRIPLLAGVALSTLLFSCGNDDEPTTPAQPQASYNGIFLVNEGDFNQGNGSIGFYNLTDSTNIIFDNDIFKTVNNVALGDIVQSLSFYNGKGYIAVNNSQKLEVVNAENFKSVASVSVGGPRFFTGISASKGYVTDWATNSVKILNLATNSFSGSILAGAGPEKMLANGQLVYVSNNGGFNPDADSTITVINSTSDMVETTVTVTPMPKGLQKDQNGKLWVVCGGQYGYGTLPERAGALVRLNMAQNQVELTLPMASVSAHPQTLAISPDKAFLYYALNDKVYRMGVNETALPTTPFISLSGANIYGLDVNPATGDLYILDSPFNAPGTMYIYSSAGVQRKVLPSGKITNAVVFKP